MTSKTPTTLNEARRLSTAALSKLNKNDLLKIIQTEITSDRSTTSATDDTLGNSDLITKIDKLLDKKFAILEKQLAVRIEDIEKKVNNYTNEVEGLRLKLGTIERKLEYSENQTRRQNFILKGIPEPENPNKAALRVIEALDIKDDLNKLGTTISTAFRLGKPLDVQRRPRNILVKLNNQEAARLITSNGKKLRSAGPSFNNVYIDRDLPPDLVSALSDLRKRAYEWKRDHAGDTAFVRAGNLVINGEIKASVNRREDRDGL